MNRKEQLLQMLNMIESSSKGSAELTKAIEFAKENGIEAGMHVGNSEKWFEEDRDSRVAEWIMGQFVEVYENNQYLAFNTGIKLGRSFLEGTY